MSALTESLKRSSAVANSAYAGASRMKAAGMADQLTASVLGGGFDAMQQRSRDKRRYQQNRGWLYAAVNALASEAAGQPVNAARMVNPPAEGGERRHLSDTKAYLLGKMTSTPRSKATQRELEVLESDPLLDSLERPNPYQNRWQFVYSFVANLNLTGWAYVVMEEREGGGKEFYSLPTTWVHPNADFTKFKIVNPKKPEAMADAEPLDRKFVAWACLPDPSDPKSALAPAASQQMAIRIDGHIQDSQEIFFENAPFPGAIITVGKNPHPDVPGGIRPRLTGPQRRQVMSAIHKASSGVANSGNPVIIDGLIEKFERLSSDHNEIGWEKSEDRVRDRILSAFCVPPFVLGLRPPSSYAAAYVTREMFCSRVNTFLDMLGTVMSGFTGVDTDAGEGGVLVWWDKCEPYDPMLRMKEMVEARKNDDISKNERRASMGYPPVVEEEEEVGQAIAPEIVDDVIRLLGPLGEGLIEASQAVAILEGMGVPADLAARIAAPEEEAGGGEGKSLGEATAVLRLAVAALKVPPRDIARKLLTTTCCGS